MNLTSAVNASKANMAAVSIRRLLSFGLKRGGKVYKRGVPYCANCTLESIILGRVRPYSVINSDSWYGLLISERVRI